MNRNKSILSLVWALFLFGFTAYAALDTFVIEHAYAELEAALPAKRTPDTGLTPKPTVRGSTTKGPLKATASPSLSPAISPSKTPSIVSTMTSYSDGNVSITLQEIRAFDSTVYAADVIVASPAHLKTAFAKNKYGRNIKARTSTIAKGVDAILAINGDYYGAREAGYVLRNGVLYRGKASRKAEDLVIYGDGTFEIVQESQISAQALLERGAVQVLSFGPALLIDGEIALEKADERGQARVSNPRTAIGFVDTLHYLFVVSDGRTKASKGLSLRELAQVLRDLGAVTAYNLDGGGSSTMVFQGRIVNKPTTNGKRIAERSVSDIVCITR